MHSDKPCDTESIKNYSALHEETLIKAQQGDNSALECVIEMYKGDVRAKSRSYFLIGADKEDLIQEGMIGLYKAIRDFNPQKHSGFRSFAELCITRQIITAVKAATRQKHIPLNSYISLSKMAFENDASSTMLMDMLNKADVNNPEEMMINREKRAGLENKLNRILSPLERNVLTSYLNGDTYGEISEKIDRPVKSIDNALQRVKRKLEKYLEEEMS